MSNDEKMALDEHIDAASLPGSYTAVITPKKAIRCLTVFNDTDADIRVSWDDGDSYQFIKAGTGAAWDFFSNKIVVSSPIKHRYDSAAGTTGASVHYLALFG